MAILGQELEINKDDIVLKKTQVRNTFGGFGCYGYISLVTTKLTIILQNMLQKRCAKCDLEQLFYNMFCKNIATLAVARHNCCPWILVK